MSNLAKEPTGKKDIIRAAIKIFAKKGYDATSVDEIAAKAKVAKGTIYYHFATKQEIFLTIIDQGIETFTTMLKQGIDAESDPGAQLTAFISIQVDFFQEYKDFCKVLLTEMWRLETHWQKEFKDLRGKYNPIAVSILKKGIDAGIFRPTINPDTVATALFNAIAFTSIEIPLMHKDIAIPSIKPQLTDMIMGGICKKE
jgi:AcrR family transcriptional regulator